MNWLYRFFGRLEAGRPRYARINLDDLNRLEPGHVTVYADDMTGNQWALMHLDDFEHAVGVGKLQIRRSETVCE